MFLPLIGLGIAALVFGLMFIMPIVTFSRLKAAADQIHRLHARLDGFETEMRRLDRALKDTSVRRAEAPTVQAAPGAEAAPTAAARPAEPAEPPRARRLFTEPAAAPPAAAPPGPPPVVAAPSASPVPLKPAAVMAARAAAEGDAIETAPGPARTPVQEDTLETRIGGRWLLYIGTIALVLGIGFFVKYAFDNNWINEVGRVLLGALVGVVMIGGGHRIARRGYPLYGRDRRRRRVRGPLHLACTPRSPSTD